MNDSITSAITSQNGTAPKLNLYTTSSFLVRLPVRTALLQNCCGVFPCDFGCDYQSERHCSKTARVTFFVAPWRNYRPKGPCPHPLTTSDAAADGTIAVSTGPPPTSKLLTTSVLHICSPRQTEPVPKTTQPR